MRGEHCSSSHSRGLLIHVLLSEAGWGVNSALDNAPHIPFDDDLRATFSYYFYTPHRVKPDLSWTDTPSQLLEVMMPWYPLS